jgi:hypothetical protein
MPPRIDIEKAIRVFVDLCMIDIIHECNNGNDFRIVIAGGRAVEYYLSPTLRDILSGEQLYSKSFDFDLVVYPLREDITGVQIIILAIIFLKVTDITHIVRCSKKLVTML